ncbi:MAG: pyruvate, phosphate dikinase, partial [candidate division Zixibacteria bacterium]|nr:pyruvate, phosphate dikinase [candidate division Zixibacteria bacterium]
ADGSADFRELLGGKGANLAEMSHLGIPVPAGFTISTEICTYFYDHDHRYPAELDEQIQQAMAQVESVMDAGFGSAENPLLVSVRSGSRSSMPGMMDTILNLGLNDVTVQGLIAQSGDERFAYDSYRRFVQMYGDVVMGVRPADDEDHDPFEALLERRKARAGVTEDMDLGAADLKALVAEFKDEIKARTGADFPDDPREQLWGAIGAVFGSWNNERAVVYRKLNDIPDEWGTAVNVQAMVYGNMGDDCATGVAFSRDPATGEKRFYGEYLINAQGEDVVAGIRTPRPIEQLQGEMPDAYHQLVSICDTLESHYKDMQDIEFTIQRGKLWMLQCRVGKRTGFSAITIAVDMVREGLIDEQEALRRVEPDQLDQLLRPVFDVEEKRRAEHEGRVLARGLNAGPGAAAGKVVFNATDAESWADRGDQVILVRIETSPEDIRGMNAAVGILTARGGMTSHAALVARQMGKVCVAGCGELDIDYAARQMRVGDQVIAEGDYISIDGSTGEVMAGAIPTIPSEVLQVLLQKSMSSEHSEVYQRYESLMAWADRNRRLKVRTNADQPDQSATARAFGAEGIGLCRTEHMFFEEDRIDSVREMILADDEAGRRKALARLLPIQRSDFIGIFEVMDGYPVTIRTLDPPLHEFLPHEDEAIGQLAAQTGVPVERYQRKLEDLREANPMLGHRGCRLGIAYPEITEMQARAIFEAASDCVRRGIKAIPEIMIPLVGHINELRLQAEVVRRTAREVRSETGVEVDYQIGTMIELPRAALTAHEIAEEAEFFSFGTNDLTQTTFGLSRDDARFIP